MKLAHHAMTWQGWLEKQKRSFHLPTMLQEIRSAGYTGVELGGDDQTLGSAKAVRTALNEAGLQLAAFCAGVTANPYPPNTEQYRREMDYAAELDCKVIMVCGGFLPEPRRTTFEADYELFAQNLADAVSYAARNGQQIAYHPHTGCIVETIAEVKRLWQFIPDLPLCIDTGHLAAVRSDPVELVELDPAKVIHIHLKDWNAEQRHFTELGEGDAGLDFKRFLQALERVNYDGWLVVERDDPELTPIESAQKSYVFLDKLMGENKHAHSTK
jgi:inosose dehydratase